MEYQNSVNYSFVSAPSICVSTTTDVAVTTYVATVTTYTATVSAATVSATISAATAIATTTVAALDGEWRKNSGGESHCS